MKLSDAVATLEHGATVRTDLVATTQNTYILAGGPKAVGLFLSEDDAVHDFLDRMELIIPFKGQFQFIEKPVLERILITATDARNTHRAAQDRFCVSSKLIVEDTTDSDG